MRRRQHLIDALHAAMAEEQRLYALVKDRGPGLAGYEPNVWQQWLEAVARTTAASKALREGFEDSIPSAE